ncbi:unnamed protein product [Cuscuta epithymum]|uniref:Peptidase A1 domain-containing protein n=1 Tax=Cuscuta epithymum TaxID=186058 RepID=A0AAV0CXZ1_9ASTE|nr:unnamed protein product [Cuscuta epithymum]
MFKLKSMNTIFFLSLAVFSLGIAKGLPEQGPTLQITHAYSSSSRPSGSWAETLRQMQTDDEARLKYLASLTAGRSDVPVANARQITQSQTYIVKAKIGTPPQTLLMAVDTSTDAAWVPCSGCAGCPTSAAGVFFNPSNSTSLKSLGCDALQCRQVSNPTCQSNVCGFNLTTGGSALAGSLLQDNVTLAVDAISNYTFGCIQRATGSAVPPQGVLGLGRGPLSLLNQAQDLYNRTFSYCLPAITTSSFTGSLRLGPSAQPKNIKFTQLMTNPRRPSVYYVNLTAIFVGDKDAKVPPTALAFDPVTGGGTVIDTGTTYTRLVTPAYLAVRDEYRRRMGNSTVSLGGFDTCYKNVVTKLPTLTFVFNTMNVTLPSENFRVNSSTGGLTCLAMAATTGFNVIGSLQQQNHRVLFDLPNSRLGVSRESCS